MEEMAIDVWEPCFVELDQRWTLARHIGGGAYARLDFTFERKETADVIAVILNSELRRSVADAVRRFKSRMIS